jgi:signal transduction histidine kinase
MGLFSVRACARAMGGEVAVLDSDLGGACFRVSFPREAVSVVATPPGVAPPG